MRDINLYLPFNGDDRFWAAVVNQAKSVKQRNKYDIDLEDLIDAIVKEEFEKAELAMELEQSISFDDEIVGIEYLGEREMMDITVSRDNLFIANDILTKNSFGVPQTADFLLALMRTEELDEIDQVLCKQIKSRYANKTDKLRFVMGVDQQKQRYYDVDDNNGITTPVKNNDAEKENIFKKQKTTTSARLSGLT